LVKDGLGLEKRQVEADWHHWANYFLKGLSAYIKLAVLGLA